jgi:CBS domain-containing protein
MTSIEEIMHKDVVTASPEETVEAVVRRMRDSAVGAALIVEDGALKALFTERDLVTRVVGDGRDPARTRVLDASTEQVVSVSPDAPIRTCAEALKNRKARHLPVVEDGRPVGIVSARDFFEILADRLEGLVGQLRYEEQLAAGEDPYDHLGGSYGR